MSAKKMIILLGVLVAAAVVSTACAGAVGPPGPAGPAGPAGPQGEPGPTAEITDLSCTECHNDTTLIVSKQAQFREKSVHGTGEAFERGTSGACAGCHGSEGAKVRINAGLPPHDPSVEGITNVSPYNCRTCHNIHTTYTRADFSLTGNDQPVTLEMTGGTFDGGKGNLCANCHQIRNELPVAADGNIDLGENTRYGPHYGVEAAMLLGEGGLGGVSGSPSAHYQAVENTCVNCHMGDERNHTYEPEVARCQTCHADAENFDINGVQTEVQAMLDEVHELLVASGIMAADYTDDAGELQVGRSIPGVYPEAVAQAMWNYKLVVYDQSRGVHNSAFAKALLQQALDALR
ncbi:MAG TPA: cytochrome c3 family protein [Anaerolineales bacterium]